MSDGSSRRGFLATVGLAALGLIGCRRTQTPASGADESNSPAPQHPSTTQARVVIARRTDALNAHGSVNLTVLAGMLSAGIRTLSGCDDETEAWQTYFGPDDRVAVKVNTLGGAMSSTHPELTELVCSGLQTAGVSDSNIIIYDLLNEHLRAGGYEIKLAPPGIRCLGNDAIEYDDDVTVVREVGTRFSRALRGCTAIVNMPLLKDHDLAGVSIALKNHFGSISNPNKLHTNHCTPYIADLNCAEVLRSKQRLIVCDALRVGYEGGPTFKPEYTVPYGGILLATDPVALDVIGLEIIEQLRAEHGLESLMNLDRAPHYIAMAGDEERQVGCADRSNIELAEV